MPWPIWLMAIIKQHRLELAMFWFLFFKCMKFSRIHLINSSFLKVHQNQSTLIILSVYDRAIKHYGNLRQESLYSRLNSILYCPWQLLSHPQIFIFSTRVSISSHGDRVRKINLWKNICRAACACRISSLFIIQIVQ